MFPLRLPPRFSLSIKSHWPWLAGLAVLCFSVGLSLVQLPAMRLQNQQLDRQLKDLDAQLRTPAVVAVQAPPREIRSQLATFDRLPVVVSDLQSLASQNGLSVSDATYKPMEATAALDIGRVEIDAHLKGTYPALKKTIASLLATHDGLALTSLSLQRARAIDVVTEIEMRLVFYYRKSA